MASRVQNGDIGLELCRPLATELLDFYLPWINRHTDCSKNRVFCILNPELIMYYFVAHDYTKCH